MITVLAMGQSNAVGWGAGGVWSFPSSVTVWNCAGNTDTGSVGSAFVAPVHGEAPFTRGHNNMMIHACRYLAAELAQDVRLILVAKGGEPIQKWSDQNGAMYARMVAVLAAANVTSVDAFFWHQGEANTPTHSTYATAWASLLTKMTNGGYITAETPIVIGELASQTTSGNMNAVLRSIADNSSRIAIADIACFGTNDQTKDIAHFTGAALVRCGLEYARELMRLPGPLNYEPAETDFPYVTAAGAAPYTPVPGKNCTVLVKAENGKKALINSGGFVADRLGVWEFSLSAITYRSSLNVILMDGSGSLLQFLVGLSAGASVPNLDGSTVIAMGKNDRAYMGVVQSTVTYAPVSPMISALINRMTVKYLGRN